MVVIDLVPRNAFVPRATPATVFGPSLRVPGGYVVYHQGRLREVVNLQVSEMTAEEVAVVKATMGDHEPPFALARPPTSEDWDARKLPAGAAEGSRSFCDNAGETAAQEAPLREEQTEPQRITVEEVLDQHVDDCVDDETRAYHEYLGQL